MRKFTSWIFLVVVLAFAGVVIWQFTKKSDSPFLMASVGDTTGQAGQPGAISTDAQAAADAAAAAMPEPTSSIVVPTTTAMQLSDPAQTKLPGTLIVDNDSTANSADGAWSASMEMIKEYPITYSFNDGAGPSLIVDDAYLLVTNLKTGAKKEIAVLDLATDKMIATAKGAAASKQFEYVTYNLAWTTGGATAGQLTGRAELYDVASGAQKLLQAAKFTVNPTTWTVKKTVL